MLVGIKYCGGCNPRYDRSSLVLRLKNALPEVDFEPVRPENEYDLLLVISGCSAQCADISTINHHHVPVMVASEEHLQRAIEKIKEHIK